MVMCDKWVAVKIFEVIFCIACLVCKRVTDDESIRLSLYLQKLSREWSLLRNITWDSIGASFGDAVYGGYVIITFGLLLGKIFREIPHGRRIIEGFLLGLGALFFIILGALELASLDSIPDGLIDNAAVLGTLSLITAALFLIDLAAPRHISTSKHSQTDAERNAFGYPKLPEVKAELKNDKPETNTNSFGPKFFPDKFKKNDKTDKGKDKKEQVHEINNPIESKDNDLRNLPGNDDVDTFISSQTRGYHKFSDENPEEGYTFEKIEKSKYGSVRNGAVKRSPMPEIEGFQKSTAQSNQSNVNKPDSPDDMVKSNMQLVEDMDKNIAYLKMLDDKQVVKRQLDRKYYEEDLARLNEQYMKEYQQRLSHQTDYEKKGYPRMGMATRTDYEKYKQWEKFEEESLPPFPVREEYLPELQTPIFARIKEKRQNKGYGIYDNLTMYNHNKRPDERSQTDTMVSSKTSTLKSKPPTLQQIAEYFGLQQKNPHKTEKREAASQVDGDELPSVSFLLPMAPIQEGKGSVNYNGGPSSPTDPGYVQYTAQQWNDRLHRKHSTRTPRHSPTDE